MRRHVFETMGTVASIDMDDAALLPAVREVFDAFESRFSLYQPDSELSRIADGRQRLLDASPELLASYSYAIRWRAETSGLFTPQRPDGVLDLNGIVKAEAIERAGAVLDRAGCANWTINVGGDLLRSADSPPQRVGVEDPDSATGLLCSVELSGARRAIATSGSAQRGDHIWRGGSVASADFRQVTVIAADIVTADVLATTIVAGGREAIDDITDRWDIDVLTVDRDSSLAATPGFTARPSLGDVSTIVP